MKTMVAGCLMLLLMGCATTASITQTLDPFTSATTIEWSKGLKLSYEGRDDVVSTLLGVQMSEYGINLRGVVSSSSPSITRLVMEYYGSEWFFIQEESAVQLLYLDGSSDTFDATDVFRDTFVSGGDVWCHEKAFIVCSTASIDSLCQGRVQLIRLNGRQVYQHLTLPEITRTRLAELWATIQAAGPPDPTKV